MSHRGTLRLIAAVAMMILAAGPSRPAAGESGPGDYPHGTFQGDCGDCHGPDGWKPAVIGPGFDHSEHGFALQGAHRSVRCVACHARLDFSAASSQCVSCHSDIHTGELGQDCARCHTTNSFVERADEIRSHRLSRFPLRGSHIALDCRECHRESSAGHLVFVNTPGECQRCHIDDYNAARSPDHAASGFSRDCQQCHTEVGWSGRGFNHALTGFALKGEHRALDCSECHTGGFSGASASCVDCHQSDYDQTTNPNHTSSAFPLDCAQCHGSSSWLGATFNHRRYFPINSGPHAGEWSSCETCHTNPSNYSVFNCLSCHPHSDKNKTDGDHRGRANYVYDSVECYACHPNGRHE